MNDILDVSEAAALLHCEQSTIEEALRDSTLPGVKFGRAWCIPRTALMQRLHDMALANKTKRPPPLAVTRAPVKVRSLRSVLPVLPGVM